MLWRVRAREGRERFFFCPCCLFFKRLCFEETGKIGANVLVVLLIYRNRFYMRGDSMDVYILLLGSYIWSHM